MSNPTTAKSITITGVELSTRSIPKFKPPFPRKYYMEFSLGNTFRRTNKTKQTPHGIIWNEGLFFDGDDVSVLLVKIYRNHRTPGKQDEPVASLTYTVGEIISKSVNNVFEERLRTNPSHTSGADFTLKFTLIIEPRKLLDADDRQVANTVDATIQAVGAMCPTHSTVDHLGSVIDTATQAVNSAQTFATTWNVLLDRIKLFDEIVTGIAGIHSYTSLAWSIISAAHKVLVNQKDRDDQITRLAGTMSDILAFVHGVDPLKAIKAHVEPLMLLIHQLMECAYFICDYAEHNRFATRVVKYTFSNIEAHITDYQSKLQELRDAFLRGVEVQVGITVVRMMNAIEYTAEDKDLDDIPYAKGARYDQDKGCLGGTREEMLHELHEILSNPAEDAPRVCLLTGVAGSGKSAVAHSIARWFEGQKRLVSSYCFARTDVASRNPTNLFSTIARDLCDHDPEYRSALWKVVGESRSLRTSKVPKEQVERFIIEPSKYIEAIGPLVIVIDALDECGDQDARQQLLPAIFRLVTETSFLNNLRFLITARPERDILAKLLPGPRLVHKQMNENSERVVNADIEKFIRHSLSEFSSELDLSKQDWCGQLVDRSQHLFQWAATACKFIQGFGAIGLEPFQRLELFLETDMIDDEYPLDGLYLTVLQQLFKSTSDQRRFREVMSIVLALKEPLPLPSLSDLFDGRLSVPANIRPIVVALASLLDGACDERKPVRPLHASFYEFLRDTRRSAPFQIPILPRHSLTLGQATLACMCRMLRFNICGLVDSRILNYEVPNLSAHVNEAIPPHLSYSCLYWMDHLQHINCDPDIVAEIMLFFKTFFPYWLEAISLLSLSSSFPISSALQTCITLQLWTQSKDQEMSNLASQASQFIQVFSPVLRRSTPHLYLSAMPQTPTSSPLHKLWSGQLLKHASISTGHPANWPADIHTLYGHTGIVTSVAYSSDGGQVVSGSSDGTIRIWDVVTGQPIGNPFQGHTDWVLSIGYSPDGKSIVSGSGDKTIKIWDVATGQSIGSPFQGHTDWVTSVGYSPDGKNIVSGSYDRTIRIWDAVTGQPIGNPFQGHADSVRSVSYSPDGKSIVSGSNDSTIRIWNAATGQPIGSPLQGHTGWVTSIDYSPDGKTIASGSYDKTIRIWDVATSQPIGSPFQGRDWITSIGYSPDGTNIVSGSSDKTIMIWDTATGQPIGGPLQGHTGWVTSVGYLPNGKNIVSGSLDNTLRIWDVATCQSTGSPFQGHTGWVTSVGCSPNGENIVSGSNDGTIRIWNAATGRPIGSPFQGHTNRVTSVGYSPDGKNIVSGSDDNTVRIWNTVTGQPMGSPFQGHIDYLRSVCYSPDGKNIVSGSADNTIRIWDVITGQSVGLFQGHTDWVRSVSYSHDGKHIVSSSDDCTIRIWDTTTGQPVGNLIQGHTDWVRSVGYSPDGKSIVSGSDDRTVRIWDTVSGQSVGSPFQGHTDWIRSVCYSSDGKRLVSGSNDCTIRIWDVVTHQLLAGPFQGHSSPVASVAFSPKGDYIISGSVDWSIKVWKVHELVSFGHFTQDDGWIFSHDLCYGWVAPWLRFSTFYLPPLLFVIGPYGAFQADIDNSVSGESWVTCWKS